MYLDFYNLTEYPFALGSDPRFFYESDSHREALANMLYTVQQQKGMVMITGQVGTGKTLLTHMLIARLGAGCLALQISNPPESGRQLLRAVARELDMEPSTKADKLQLIEELQPHLQRLQARGRQVALIFDEAQALADDALEEVRRIWNWERSGRRLAQVILVGQPELRDRLNHPRWESLRQRIVLSYHLSNFSPDDTARYIEHRIRTAAKEGCMIRFSPRALAEIHKATDGTPRLINVLCDNCLLVGFSRSYPCINLNVVHEVLRTMTCWNLKVPDSLDAAEPTLPPEQNPSHGEPHGQRLGRH